MRLPALALSTGDPGGVGPAICAAAAARFQARARCVLFGPKALLEPLLRAQGVSFTVHSSTARSWDAVQQGTAQVWVVDTAEPDAGWYPHAPTAAGGRTQVASLDAAISALEADACAALVTAPMSKEAVNLAGTAFSGHTEYLASKAGLATDEVTMLFAGPRLCVSLVTTHVPIRSLCNQVTKLRVTRAGRHLAGFLQERSRQSGALRVAVCGLNPHAGEGGVLGDDELRVVAPAVEELRSSHPEVEWIGPVGAETALRWASEKQVDGVVAQFHDQATIASKLLDWGQAVNVTWGLPYLRTSVDHGVAYDAAALQAADATGMYAAMELALEMLS